MKRIQFKFMVIVIKMLGFIVAALATNKSCRVSEKMADALHKDGMRFIEEIEIKSHRER